MAGAPGAPGSSGGEDAAGSGGGDGASVGPAEASVVDGGAGTSNPMGPAAADAARDAPGSDANHTDAAPPGHVDGGSSLDAVRQACVDNINMHRATLGLTALTRATGTEACSDRGAMQDATTNMAHSSAGMCPGTGGQDTCPYLPVGGATGATLLSSLTQCLDQMWAEGPPPTGTTVMQCIQDYTGCFLKHGHWINMSAPGYTNVSCGFYLMSNGAYWGNQDFGPLSGSP
jgi:hypothetical protein